MPDNVQSHYIGPKPDVPNSPLPVLIYRGVLPVPHSEENATNVLTSNKWEKRGTWGHIGVPHFHPNTHECYGIFQGNSKLLLGQISQKGEKGIEVDVKAGDVIVLPAGTAHSNITSSPDYQYIGVYPQNGPKYTYQLGDRPGTDFEEDILQVALPEADPVYGVIGPLMTLWKDSGAVSR